MSKINKYARKEEIEEFLDELKLENHVKQHGEIKAFVLEYMLKNPPGKGCVVQVGTFGKTTGSDTRGQNAHGLIISYVCPRLIPLVGDQLMQKRIVGHHVCCRYDGSTKQYVIQIQFNQSNEITDASINAAKENMTDMFYHTDEHVTENEIDNFLDGLQIEWLIKEHQAVREFIRGILIDNLPVPNRAIKVTTIGEIPASVGQLPIFSGSNRTKEFGFDVRYQTYQTYQTPAPDSSKFKQRQIGDHHVYGGYNADIKEFVISVRFNNYNKFQDNSENVRASILKSREEAAQSQKEIEMTQENKDQGEATKYGPDLTVKEITDLLIGLGVSANDIKESFIQLPTRLAIGKLPNVTIHRVGNKITLTYGNTEKAILLDKSSALDENLPGSMRLSPEEIRYEAFNDVVNQSGLYIYTVSPKEENNTNKEQNEVTASISETENQIQSTAKETLFELGDIANQITELNISDFWANMFMYFASNGGYSEGIPNPRITNTQHEVCVAFGETKGYIPSVPEKLEAFGQKMEWKINEYGGIFYIPCETEQKEIMKVTTEDFIKKNYSERLKRARLSDEAVQVIVDKLFNSAGLKKPTAQSSLIATTGDKVVNVFYSHDTKPVTITPTEGSVLTSICEDVSFSVGTEDAFFVVDTTNVKTFEEKMIHQHLGVPKVKLELSSGYSVGLPFKKTYESVTRDHVLVRITCDTLVSVSAKALENLSGPALTDLQETQADRYFIRGNELTEEVFHKRAALGAGSWTDIEKA